MKRLVMVGAGKIGRGFIAQVFSRCNYKVCFVEKDPVLVSSLNRDGSYRLIHTHPYPEILIIKNVRAVSSDDKGSVEKEISEADLLAVSVGHEAFPLAMDLISVSIMNCFRKNPGKKYDIILAENDRRIREKAMTSLLNAGLDREYVETNIGLVETALGKMIPLTTREISPDLEAEAFNDLIVSRPAFRNGLPSCRFLVPKDNISAWIDRKLFIHNLGHAALAYISFNHNPGLVYTWQALETDRIKKKTMSAMFEASGVLQHMHPGEFSDSGLREHMEDLLARFGNRALNDTIGRVGMDIERKTGPDDRLVPVIRYALEHGIPCTTLMEVLLLGFSFRAGTDGGQNPDPDSVFLQKFNYNVPEILLNHCKFDPVLHKSIFLMAEKMK